MSHFVRWIFLFFFSGSKSVSDPALSSTTSDFTLVCPQCSEVFSSITSLKEHLQGEHQVDPVDLAKVMLGQNVEKSEDEENNVADSQVRLILR